MFSSDESDVMPLMPLGIEASQSQVEENMYDAVFNLLTEPLTKTEWYQKCRDRLTGITLMKFNSVASYLVVTNYVHKEDRENEIGADDTSVKVHSMIYWPIP
jgi:hypothetical protein